ncbi:MAG TPA: hypothetical protein VGI85_03290 [Chthoniobacterales bacterium]|jgi:N-carbamoyl-L-amino-acid hydrolase
MSELNPRRTIDELKELRRLTSDENGAQRVAFTTTWAKAHSWLEEKARALGAEVERDQAGARGKRAFRARREGHG